MPPHLWWEKRDYATQTRYVISFHCDYFDYSLFACALFFPSSFHFPFIRLSLCCVRIVVCHFIWASTQKFSFISRAYCVNWQTRFLLHCWMRVCVCRPKKYGMKPNDQQKQNRRRFVLMVYMRAQHYLFFFSIRHFFYRCCYFVK